MLAVAGVVPLAAVDRLRLSLMEYATALAPLASTPYFMRLADVAERLLALDADDGGGVLPVRTRVRAALLQRRPGGGRRAG